VPSDELRKRPNSYSDQEALAERDWVISGEPITEKDIPHGVFPAGKPTKVCEPVRREGTKLVLHPGETVTQAFDRIRAAARRENAAYHLLADDSAIERMVQYLWPKVYIGTPDKARALVRGMLEAAKVLE
jgi:hypothetical protein